MRPVIAVFDFDHTLIDRDSLLPFLFYHQGFLKASLKLFTLFPVFLLFACGLASRQKTKEQIITKFFKGISLTTLKEQGEKYAIENLDRFINQEAFAKLKWHQAQGHRCLIISASLDIYLFPWAEKHGFETALCSRLNANAYNQVTGQLSGINCWGPEKVKRLLAFAGPKEGYELYAYGDSRGDQELLQLADFPFYRRFSD